MTVMTLTSEGFTRADLDAWVDVQPESGWRYELIDGLIIVQASPRHLHQRAVGNLYLLLRAACPPEQEVLLAPFDVALADDTVVIPDLLMAPVADIGELDLQVAPRLVIEVLSPSTRRVDLTLKKDRFERAQVAHYWVVDPREPSITAWELRDGAYVEVSSVHGDDTFAVDRPLKIETTPAHLITHGRAVE